MSSKLAVAAAPELPSNPKLTTLREAVDRDGVPPAPSAKQRRLMDVHVTAYPNLLNTSMLPAHQTAAQDFSSINPVQYRKDHTVRNNNAGSYSGKEDNVLDMCTTSQFANRLTQLGVQMRAARVAHPESAPAIGNLEPRGYHSRFLAPSFDERSTYRWDYCQFEASELPGAAGQSQLATYREEWSADEKTDVDASMRVPFLTQPVSSDRLKDKATVYRKDFMPEATRQEFRMLSHKTNLTELGTTFAYSGYSVDDPRREVTYNPAIAALKGLHGVVDKTFSPSASFAAKKSAKQLSAREELEQLRTMRRETMQKSTMSGHAASTAVCTSKRPSSTYPDAEGTNPVVIPGIKGSGYRRAPKDNDNYVYLPRDHFCYQAVDNY